MTQNSNTVLGESILEMAEETLTTLSDYSEVLEDLSQRTAELEVEKDFQEQFIKLLDGIGTFTESIAQVKSVLKSGYNNRLNTLESDLASILRDLLGAQERINVEYRKELLKNHLPTNLNQWRNQGIPSIKNPQ